MTTRTVEGMAPYPGQARCLALGFWPECFRRLDVKGGQRPFPKCARQPCGLPWTPETAAAPGARKSGQAQACPRAARGAQTPRWRGARATRTPGKHLNWRSIVTRNGKITNLGWCQGSSEANPSRIK
jgi:hypothetical protein